MTAYERLIDALRDNGRTVTVRDSTTMAQCPAHNDGRPSLSLRSIDGQVLLYCHAGCTADDVTAALNLTMADLFDDRQGARYEYPDGRTVVRTPEKRFTQRGNTKGDKLFHADRINGADTVYVVEGEKDVLAVESAGGAAVCPAMGAGKAKRFDWSPLAHKAAVVVADRDEPGRRHAADVVELLSGRAATVRIVEAAVGKDAADHLAAGKTLDEFVVSDDGMPKLWRATDLKAAQQARSIATNRLLRASINLLIGDEGIGKSLLWVWVVAAVTTGKSLPEFGIPPRDPGHVLIVVTEDDWSTTVLPRLIVAGADLDRISVICIEQDGSGSPVFPRDIELIKQAAPAPVMVVVDAWLDTVPGGLSVRDPQQARQALAPFKDVATTTGAAVLLLCHTNRIASGNPRDRYGATGVLRQKARMTLYAQQDEEGRLIVGPEKVNTTTAVPASTFTISPVQHFPPSDENDGTVPLLVYAGNSTLTARQHLVSTYEAEHGEDAQDRADAVRWLTEYLEIEGPAARSSDAKLAAKKAGISERTLQRARSKLGVIVSYTGQPPQSTWTLSTSRATDEKEGGVYPGVLGTSGISSGHSVMPVVPLPEVGITGTASGPADMPVMPEMTDTQTSSGTSGHHGAETAVDGVCWPRRCPACERAPARTDSGLCDFCTVKTHRQTGGVA
jgi:hypothetical protein